MKNILFTILLFLCMACEENKSVDPSIMPEITTTGENTFGCLVDGWVYASGRWGLPTAEYINREDTSYVKIVAEVGFESYVRFTIPNPKPGETISYVDVSFDYQSVEDGKAHILRMDNGIISGTFEGKRLTKGRFDLKYKE